MVRSTERIKELRHLDQERRAKMPGRGNYPRKPEHAEKIKATQLRRVAEGTNNRAIQKTCIHCGLEGQHYMIDRWHNDNCPKLKEEREKVWLYISPKLRGLKVR